MATSTTNTYWNNFTSGIKYIFTSPFIVTKKVFLFSFQRFEYAKLNYWSQFLSWFYNKNAYEREMLLIGKYRYLIYDDSLLSDSIRMSPVRDKGKRPLYNEDQFTQLVQANPTQGLSYYQHKLYETNHKIEKLTNELSALQQQPFHIFKEEYATLVKTLENRIETLTKVNLPVLHEQIETATSQKDDRLTQLNTVYQRKLAEIEVKKERDINLLEERIQKEREEFFKTSTQLKQTMDQYRNLNDELQTIIKNTNKQLNQQQQEFLTENSQLKRQLDQQQQQLQEQSNQITQLTTINKRLVTDFHIIEVQRDSLQEQLNLEQVKLQDLEEKLKQVPREKHSIEQQHKVYVDALEKTNQKLTTVLTQVRAERDANVKLACSLLPNKESDYSQLKQTQELFEKSVMKINKLHDGNLIRLQNITEAYIDLHKQCETRYLIIDKLTGFLQTKSRVELDIAELERTKQMIDLIHTNKSQPYPDSYPKVNGELEQKKEQLTKVTKQITDLQKAYDFSEKHIQQKNATIVDELAICKREATAFSTDYNSLLKKYNNYCSLLDILTEDNNDLRVMKIKIASELTKPSSQPILSKYTFPKKQSEEQQPSKVKRLLEIEEKKTSTLTQQIEKDTPMHRTTSSTTPENQLAMKSKSYFPQSDKKPAVQSSKPQVLEEVD